MDPNFEPIVIIKELATGFEREENDTALVHNETNPMDFIIETCRAANSNDRVNTNMELDPIKTEYDEDVSEPEEQYAYDDVNDPKVEPLLLNVKQEVSPDDYGREIDPNDSTERLNLKMLSQVFECTICQTIGLRKCSCVKQFECEVCLRKFTHNYAYSVHKLKHTGDKPYECDLCPRRFIQKSHLTVHRRQHTGEKPFECEFCQKRFNLNGHLIVHRRVHTGEKPFKCIVCDKRFAKNCNLTTHLRKHTGEKPFECQTCHSRFFQESSLTAHKRTHSGERPYECDICQKRFNRGDILSVHKRKHSGEKPYECPVCHERFTHNGSLIAHKRKQHVLEAVDAEPVE